MVAEPSEKSPQMEEMLNRTFGRTDAITNDRCVMDSTHNATEFRDDLSRKEYTISGLCQECQDAVFGGEE